jgi:hypothetical protein
VNKYSFYIYFFLFNVTYSLNAQQDCAVLIPKLTGTYIGDCKNGLAHGRGIAVGIDQYTGHFKKGWPHGQGTYKWSTGEIYEGEWKYGLRNGYGKFTFEFNNCDTVLEGIWLDDMYMGPEKALPSVISKQNIERVVFKRNRDGAKVTISFTGVYHRDINNLTIIGDSGSEFSVGMESGYDYVEFPFHCKVLYTTLDASQTQEQYCILEFIINQPGEWTVYITN